MVDLQKIQAVMRQMVSMDETEEDSVKNVMFLMKELPGMVEEIDSLRLQVAAMSGKPDMENLI